MSSTAQYYAINIERNSYSYGFDLKDEETRYSKYATVSKITNNVASNKGLKVGDRIVSINGEEVAGKDYITLRRLIRKSLDNCVRLEVLKEKDFKVISPETFSSDLPFSPMKLHFGRNLIPSGSAREKICLFENDDKNGATISGISNSCDYINKCADTSPSTDNPDQRSSSSNHTTSVSVDNLMEDDESSGSSDIHTDVNRTISQEPFVDDSISVAENIVKIQLPSSNHGREFISKSQEHIRRPLSVNSHDTVFELISEPFDDKPMISPVIPKLEMPGFPSCYSISSSFAKLSPEFITIKSRSSNNIFQGWSEKSDDNKVTVDYGSMTNISSSKKTNFYEDKKLCRKSSTMTHIPIKLRIIQFHDRVKTKGWKDYIIEAEPNGARFRKRHVESQKSDRTSNFIIRVGDVNKFEIDSPHRRHKLSSSNEAGGQESFLKYSLMAFNNRVQIKFHFNPTIFQDDESSRRACVTYKEIINSFKAAENRSPNSMQIHSLSESSSISQSLCESQRNHKTVKESNSSIDEVMNTEFQTSANNSYKSNSKSSAENLSASFLEMSQTTSKSIFKQAMGKMKPEKKIKVTQTYQVFTGTKAEFEEFQKQLEGGHLPLELDSSDEHGINFNKFIYEVPRMSVHPKIPMIIYLCTTIVEKVGLKVEGVYRISGNQRVIRTLAATLNKPLDEIETHLPEWKNVHAVCGTLKLFLRQLKQYLIPADLSHVLAYSCKAVDCDDPKSLSKTLMDIRYHLSQYQMPSRRKADSNIVDQSDCRWESLRHILRHLAQVVACREFNSMDERAISICFNPVLMESWQKNLNDIKADNEIMIRALELILVHQDWLFDNWHSEMDGSWNTELMENARKYAAEYIDKKYDFNFKCSSNTVEHFDNKDEDINGVVREIVAQSTLKFEEKRKLERRHSSHTPGQRPVILRDVIDQPDTTSLRRNSQTTDALDLFTCANWLKNFAKVPTIDENKEIKMTYIPCTDRDCYQSGVAGPRDQSYDNTVPIEPEILRGRTLRKQVPLERQSMRLGDCPKDHNKDMLSHSSESAVNSDTHHS